jgi:integrase/recombinase XerD
MFIQFLQHQGELPLPVTPPSITDRWPVLGDFRLWMRQHRGLAETTLDVYQWILVRLLDALGDDANSYSAEALRAFVLDRAHLHAVGRAQSIVVAVRSFLRFLVAMGRCRAGLEQAIPGFASWRLSSVPRFLVAEDVERVIGSCTNDVFKLRDRAVRLLLARLGLRASEVAQLKFADLDWRKEGITVCGKGRRQELLPLPQEVGNAILRYLNQSRPPLRVPEVFTTILAPIHPLTRAAVTHIVRSALPRAAIKAPSILGPTSCSSTCGATAGECTQRPPVCRNVSEHCSMPHHSDLHPRWSTPSYIAPMSQLSPVSPVLTAPTGCELPARLHTLHGRC